MSKRYSAGDLVTLVSGGLQMTVVSSTGEDDAEMVGVAYDGPAESGMSGGRTIRRDNFPANALIPFQAAVVEAR